MKTLLLTLTTSLLYQYAEPFAPVGRMMRPVTETGMRHVTEAERMNLPVRGFSGMQTEKTGGGFIVDFGSLLTTAIFLFLFRS